MAEEEKDFDPFKSNYAQKKADAQHLKETSVTFDKVAKETKKAMKAFVNDTKQAAKNVQDVLTPALVKNVISRFRYKKDVAAAETKIAETFDDINSTIKEEARDYRRAKAAATKRKAKLKRDKAGEQLQHAVIENEEEERKKMDFSEYHERRDKQIKEREAKVARVAAKKQAAADKVVHDRRSWRSDFWGEQAQILKRENEILQTARFAGLEQKYNDSLDAISSEWADRDFARSRVQVEGPKFSAAIELPGRELGVFGIPLGPGEFAAPDGGYVQGLDQHDAKVLDSAPQTDFDSRQVDFVDVEMQVGQKQMLYDVLKEEVENLAGSHELIGSMRAQAERDKHQVEQELQEILNRQAGPPKRLAIPAEIESTHHRKERINLLAKKLEDIEHSLDVATKKKRTAEAQMLTLAQQIAALRERQTRIGTEQAAVNDGLGRLPVVVGRSLDTVPGMGGLQATPKAMMDAVVHSSKVIKYKDQQGLAMKAHRARVGIDQDLWLLRQSENEDRAEVERTISRMKLVSDKLKDSIYKNTKISIVEALQAFAHSGTKLNKVNAIVSGALNWAKDMKPDMSRNIARYGTAAPLGAIVFDDLAPLDWEDKNGVTLDKAHTGICQGSISLPKNCMWSISLTVLRDEDFDPEDPGDETDYVTIRLGPAFHSMQVIGQYHNKINPDTGCVLWDVNHVVRGTRLCFRFDFASSSKKVAKHLCIMQGLYEEYHMAGLEVIPDPNGIVGRTRVLSSYVKTIRVEESQGKLRLTKLLEELIDSEDNKTKSWDSEIMQYYPQRYPDREFFMRILRAEILLEQSLMKKSRTDEGGRNMIVVRDAAQMKRLMRSKANFQARKREAQQEYVEEGLALVGKRIDVWNPEKSFWRHMLVQACDVRWIDNGLTAKLVHDLDEFNELNEPMGSLKLDLSTVRWFESAQQDIDPEALARYRQMREWMRRLAELERMAQDTAVAYRTSFEKYRRKQEKAYKNEIENCARRIAETGENDAKEELLLPQVKDEVNRELNVVLLDIRKGIVTLEGLEDDDEGSVDLSKISLTSETVRNQALKEAEARYVKKRLKEMRDDADLYLERKNAKKHKRIQQALEEHQDGERRTMDKITKERLAMELFIREQKAAEKAALMARVKFDKKVFDVAVPKADVCEHIKCKAWGNEYGKGVKCMSCGKEVTELYKEESQGKGYGSGCTPWLHDAINRHRKNEAAFRFKAASELRKVESERIRLEKERRIMQEQEVYFYDFHDLKVVYEFDQRHAADIKDSGAFRQGLQWTPDELEAYEERKLRAERIRIEQEGLLSTEIEKFDPLANVEEPPPTFRADDERKKAQYTETMFGMGRLHNFQKKIVELKDARAGMLLDRNLFSDVLFQLHREQFKFDSELAGIEGDLARTSKLLSTYETMTRLWKKASLILRQADKDKKKSEMRHVGCWDDVREAQEKSSLMKDETRSLLRLKFTYEQQLKRLLKSKSDYADLLINCQTRMDVNEKERAALAYCRPGDSVFTRYGWGKVRVYREEDRMLILTMDFGAGAGAKVYITADEVVDADRARQSAERLLMDDEDRRTQRVVSMEKAVMKRELYGMRQAEVGYKEMWHFLDFWKHEKKEMHDRVQDGVSFQYQLTQSKRFQKVNGAVVEKRVKVIVDANLDEIETYKRNKGPKSGLPDKLTSKEITDIRKNIDRELKTAFLNKGARDAHVRTANRLHEEREDWMVKRLITNFIRGITDDMMKTLAVDSIREGMEAKKTAERTSGLIVPKPSYMQYSSYCLIRDLWKERKKFLKRELEMRIGEFKKKVRMEDEGPMDEDSATALKEAKAAKKREEERQERLCREMDVEEELCRKFYHWELLQNLRERREMAAMEREMRQLLKEEAAMEAAKKTQYATSKAVAEREAKKAQVSDADRRRDELKEVVIERRRIADEISRMEEEDALSVELMKIDRADRARAEYEKIFGATDMDDIPEEEQFEGEIPVWMVLPPDWDEMNKVEKEKFIEKETSYHDKVELIIKNRERDRKLWRKMERESLKAWKDTYMLTQVRSMGSELAWMVTEEEQRQNEERERELRTNIKQLEVFCRVKGEMELHARTDLRKKQETARAKEEDLKVTTNWHALCLRRSRNRDKLKRRVTEECKWSDTDSINGTYQRFRTERLRERLYWVYFNKITDMIVNRAETIATERRIMRVQEALSANKKDLEDRTSHMKRVWRELQRDELMRLTRLGLNQQGFFPKERKKTLKERFSGWLRFFLWNRGHREAYELKYELLKRQLDVQRQFKKQLNPDKQPEGSPTKRNIISTMQRHRERPVQCRHCLSFYVESQNNSFACMYHPGKYMMLCPRSCPSPGLTHLCIAHKKTRWSCCESTRSGTIGCARRYHVPADADPIYDKMMSALNERDKELLEGLDQKLEVARKERWTEQNMAVKRGQVWKAEDLIADDRALVEYAEKIKYM